MGILQVGLGERSYPIFVESGCLATVPAELAARWPASCYCLVADDTVAALHGQELLEALRAADLTAEMLSFPAGEASKTIETVAWLASAAARLGLDRHSMIIALGGGVTGDLAGFLASAYLRGVDFVQVPTSLLAQVDSSVGGKTGVDLPEGKNLFGAFYQPKGVFIDLHVLQTLPEIQYRNGLAEVIKYGVIREPTFLDYLEQHRDAILALEPTVVSEMVLTCCRIKADVVAADEREGDLRRILNFGHTIGHAVEAASRFEVLHGMAVAIGMVAASRIAVSRGMLSAERAERITGMIAAYGLPTEIPETLDRRQIKSYLLTDKKRIGGTLFFILPRSDGSVVITDEVTEADIDAVLAVGP
ncbi:3-dehydroquinate synthase [Desulfofustis glycolicus]|uniref:3-dehydroquinate synthase n=1 Tax=Desulfofustis glycolicus DSM 9705 TaxID=1121409 RepID=A0A1M5X891_9BACT|nr:3-dehydroquinate synthase [Desulfofustis glycolicus]MCB2218108.1 3-dehydroquinate synthase [Desulfobulbaceae bacterium]SHH96019.1 3-dehydroquinate synthase [Desulfofustis glycolicus DSM 9705]